MITRADSNTLMTFSEAAAVNLVGSRPGTTTSSAMLLSPTGSRGHSSIHGGHSGKHFMNASTVSSLSGGRAGLESGVLGAGLRDGMNGGSGSGGAGDIRTSSRDHHHHHRHQRQSSITSNSHNPMNFAAMSVVSAAGSLSMHNQWFDIEEALGVAITAAVRGAGVLVEAEEWGRVESASVGFVKATARSGPMADTTPSTTATPVTATATGLSNASTHSRRSGTGNEQTGSPPRPRSKANSIPSTKASPMLSSVAAAGHHSGSSFTPPSLSPHAVGAAAAANEEDMDGGMFGPAGAARRSGSGAALGLSSRSVSPPLKPKTADTTHNAAVSKARETVVRYLQAYTDRVVQASLSAPPHGPFGAAAAGGAPSPADSSLVLQRVGTPPPPSANVTATSSIGSPLPMLNSPSAGGLQHLNVSHTAAALPSLGSPRHHTGGGSPSPTTASGGGGGGGGIGSAMGGGHLSPGTSSSSIPGVSVGFGTMRSSTPQTPTMVSVAHTATGVPPPATSLHLPSIGSSFGSHGQLRSPPLSAAGERFTDIDGDEENNEHQPQQQQQQQQQLCHAGATRLSMSKEAISVGGSTPPLLSSLQLSGSSTSSSRVPLLMTGASTTVSPPPKSKLLQGNGGGGAGFGGGGNSSPRGTYASGNVSPPIPLATPPTTTATTSGLVSWTSGAGAGAHVSPKSSPASRTPSPMIHGSSRTTDNALSRRRSLSGAPPMVITTPRPPSPEHGVLHAGLEDTSGADPLASTLHSFVDGGSGGGGGRPSSSSAHTRYTGAALHISTATQSVLLTQSPATTPTVTAVPALRMKVLRPDEAPPFPVPTISSPSSPLSSLSTTTTSTTATSWTCSTCSRSYSGSSSSSSSEHRRCPQCRRRRRRSQRHHEDGRSPSESANDDDDGSEGMWSSSSSSSSCTCPSESESCSFSDYSATTTTSTTSPSTTVSSLSTETADSMPVYYASASRPTLVQQGSDRYHAATHPGPHHHHTYSTSYLALNHNGNALNEAKATTTTTTATNSNNPATTELNDTNNNSKEEAEGPRESGWVGEEISAGVLLPQSHPQQQQQRRLPRRQRHHRAHDHQHHHHHQHHHVVEVPLSSPDNNTTNTNKNPHLPPHHHSVTTTGSSSPLPPLLPPPPSSSSGASSPAGVTGSGGGAGAATTSAATAGIGSVSSTAFLPLRAFSSPVSPFGGTLGSRRFGPAYGTSSASPQYSWVVDLNEMSAARGLPDTYVSVTLVRDSEPELSVLFFPFAKEKFAWNPHAQGGSAAANTTSSFHSSQNNPVPHPPTSAPLSFGVHGPSGGPQRSGSVASVNAMNFAPAGGFSGFQEGRRGTPSKFAEALSLSPAAIGLSAVGGGGGATTSSVASGGGGGGLGGGSLRTGRVGSAGGTSMGGSSIFAFANTNTLQDHHDVCNGSPPPTPRSGVHTPPPPPFSMPHSTFSSPGNSPQVTMAPQPASQGGGGGGGTGTFNTNSPFFLPPSIATGTGAGFDRSPSLQFPPLSPSSPAPSVHGMRDGGGLLTNTPSASYYHSGAAGLPHFTPWWTGGELFISVEDRGAFLNGVRLTPGTIAGGGTGAGPSGVTSLVHHRVPFNAPGSGRNSPNQLYHMLPTPPPTAAAGAAASSTHSHPNGHHPHGPAFQSGMMHEHSQHSYHPIGHHSGIVDRMRQPSLGTIITELASASASTTSSPNRVIVDPLPNPPLMAARPTSRRSHLSPGLRSSARSSSTSSHSSSSSSTATLDFSTAVAAAASASPLSRAVVLLHSKAPPAAYQNSAATATFFTSSSNSLPPHTRLGSTSGNGTHVEQSPAGNPSARAPSLTVDLADELRQHQAEQDRLTDIAADLVVHHDIGTLQYGFHPVAAMAAIAAGRADVLLNTGVYYLGWHHLLGAALLVREAGGYVKGITGTTGGHAGGDGTEGKKDLLSPPSKITTADHHTDERVASAFDNVDGDPSRRSRRRHRRHHHHHHHHCHKHRQHSSQRGGSTPPPPDSAAAADGGVAADAAASADAGAVATPRRGKGPAGHSRRSRRRSGPEDDDEGGAPPPPLLDDPTTPGPGEVRQRQIMMMAAAAAAEAGIGSSDNHNNNNKDNEVSSPPPLPPTRPPCHERTGTLSPLSSEDDDNMDEEKQKKRLQQKTKTFNACSAVEGLSLQSHTATTSSIPSGGGSPLLLAEVMTVEENTSGSMPSPPRERRPSAKRTTSKKKRRHHHHHHHHHSHSRHTQSHRRAGATSGEKDLTERRGDGKHRKKSKGSDCTVKEGEVTTTATLTMQEKEEEEERRRRKKDGEGSGSGNGDGDAGQVTPGTMTLPTSVSGDDLIHLHVPDSRRKRKSATSRLDDVHDDNNNNNDITNVTGEEGGERSRRPQHHRHRHQRHHRRHHRQRRSGDKGNTTANTTANHTSGSSAAMVGGSGPRSSNKRPFLLHASHGASCSSVLLSPSSTGGGGGRMGGGGPPSSSPSFRRGTRRRDRRHRHHLRRGQRVPSQSFSDDFLMDDEGGPNQVYRAPHSPSEIVGIIAALDPQVVEVMSHICMEKKLGVKVEREGEES